MEAKTDLDISRKLPTDGCLLDFGTFDKHGFIYVPSCIAEQCQSAPVTGDCAPAAATQASSLQESDSSEKIAPPGKGKVQMTPIAKDPGESQGSSLLQESGSSDKIVPTTGEGNVQKTLIREDPADSVRDVIVDKLKKRKLDADSPEVVTGSFRRSRLMNNLWYLAVINKMSNGVRRKDRKTSG